MKVSVVIAAYNSAALLAGCLEALGRQTMPPENFELIVVDDGSTDDTRQVCERAGARYIYQENQGPAVARNLGVREARGEVVAFTDADCLPEPDWLEQLTAPFAAQEVSAAKGAYRSRQPELVARLVQLEYEAKYERLKRFCYIDFIDTYSAAYRREVFLASGGFDERYTTASLEDQELSFRLHEGGHKMVFRPQALVYHRHPASLGDYWRKKYKNGYWKAFLIRAHPGRVRGDHHTPQAYKLQIALAALLPPLLVAAPFSGLAAAALGGVGGLFLAASVPFMWFAAPRDKAVALLYPALSLVRSLGLAAGLLVGFGAHFLGQEARLRARGRDRVKGREGRRPWSAKPRRY
jgi:glycosyltransferase involved in cell wall biosynthesis